MDKEEKFKQVAEAALKILIQSGLRHMTHSALSRHTRVSRAWIYKYIGKDRDALLLFCVDLLGRLFSDIDEPPLLTTRETWEKNARNALKKTLANAKLEPSLVHVYFKFRHTRTPIGEKLAELEKKYITRIAKEIRAAYQVDQESALLAAESHMLSLLTLIYRSLVPGADLRNSRLSEIVISSVRGVLSKPYSDLSEGLSAH